MSGGNLIGDVIPGLELLGSTLAHDSQLISDLELLAPLLGPFRAGTLDFNAMAQAKKLRPVIKALRRVADAIDADLDGKYGEEDIGEILQSLPSV